MFIKITEQSTGKTLVSLALIPLFLVMFCAAPVLAASRRAAAPGPLTKPEAYPDNYVLTQLFYSAFHADDLAFMQEIVNRGMSAYPDDFTRFMALTLELAKKPDARLFTLLAPDRPRTAGNIAGGPAGRGNQAILSGKGR